MRNFFVFLALFFLTSKSSFGATDLTIRDFLVLAEKNDLNLKKIVKDQEKINFLLDQNLPSKKILIQAEGERGFGSDSESGTSVISGALSKEIIESGTKVSVSHSKTSQPDREEDVTEFRVEQALYKNLFGRDVRLKKSALKEEEEIVRLQVLEGYEDYLSQILIEYLDYQKAYLDKGLAEVALGDAQRLNRNVIQKRKKKIASQTDVDKSTLQVILRKEDVLLKERVLKQKWSQIEQITGESEIKNPTQKLFPKIFEYYESVKKSIEDITDHRGIRILELNSSIANKDLTLAKREGGPSLSLIGGYDIDNSQRFSSKVNREEAIVGLKLEMPLWDSQKTAETKSAAYDFSKSEIELNITRRQYQTELEQLMLKLNELDERKSLTAEKLKVSQRIIRDEKERYNYGRIGLDDLISHESNYFLYQYQLQSEELEFGKAILQWLAFTDRLLEVKNRF